MTRLHDLRLATALLCGFMLSMAPPTSVGAQEPAHAPRVEQQAWPRWEGAAGTPVAPPPATALQDLPPGSDARVLGLSTLGAAVGWMGGALLGAGLYAGLCYDGCDDDWDGVLAVLALGVAGGGVGSTLSGCSVAGESGCTRRVLPTALLGSLASAAASVAVISTTESGLAGLVTFSVVQGLLTTMSIR